MPSILWDHSVHYVNDLDLAIRQFTEHGLRACRGGSHTSWGTHNALSYFGLTYHEFLAIENQALAEQTDHHNHVVRDAVQALPLHQGLSRVALRTDDIEVVSARLQRLDLEVAPIIDGHRLNLQGKLIEWRMLNICGDFQGLRYPFIIQWKGSDDERLASLQELGVIQPHPVGLVVLAEAEFTVQDPQATAAHWSRVFGFPLTELQGDPALQVADKLFRFRAGENNQLAQLNFLTDSSVLRGQTLQIGEGRYTFS
ncbi:VOC family protein [Aeromonas jandaei]|nr:VOC family protein [Aeromonas jandaei]